MQARNDFMGPGRPRPQLTSRSSAQTSLRKCHWPGYFKGRLSLAIDLGDAIVRAGDRGGEMYFVCRDEFKTLGRATERACRIGAGELFGEMAVLFDQHRSVTVRSGCHCDLLALDAADYRRIASDFLQMKTEFRRITASRQSRPASME
jgi:CRP-like cAMP-binding protein